MPVDPKPVTNVTPLKLHGREYMIVPKREYDRLIGLAEAAGDDALPAMPKADEHGNRPARAFLRASIARDIIRERQALGLTQEQLAKLAGVRQETVSRLESAKYSPNVTTVEKIDRAMKKAARQAQANGKTRTRKAG